MVTTVNGLNYRIQEKQGTLNIKEYKDSINLTVRQAEMLLEDLPLPPIPGNNEDSLRYKQEVIESIKKSKKDDPQALQAFKDKLNDTSRKGGVYQFEKYVQKQIEQQKNVAYELAVIFAEGRPDVNPDEWKAEYYQEYAVGKKLKKGELSEDRIHRYFNHFSTWRLFFVVRFQRMIENLSETRILPKVIGFSLLSLSYLLELMFDIGAAFREVEKNERESQTGRRDRWSRRFFVFLFMVTLPIGIGFLFNSALWFWAAGILSFNFVFLLASIYYLNSEKAMPWERVSRIINAYAWGIINALAIAVFVSMSKIDIWFMLGLYLIDWVHECLKMAMKISYYIGLKKQLKNGNGQPHLLSQVQAQAQQAYIASIWAILVVTMLVLGVLLYYDVLTTLWGISLSESTYKTLKVVGSVFALTASSWYVYKKGHTINKTLSPLGSAFNLLLMVGLGVAVTFGKFDGLVYGLVVIGSLAGTAAINKAKFPYGSKLNLLLMVGLVTAVVLEIVLLKSTVWAYVFTSIPIAMFLGTLLGNWYYERPKSESAKEEGEECEREPLLSGNRPQIELAKQEEQVKLGKYKLLLWLDEHKSIRNDEHCKKTLQHAKKKLVEFYAFKEFISILDSMKGNNQQPLRLNLRLKIENHPKNRTREYAIEYSNTENYKVEVIQRIPKNNKQQLRRSIVYKIENGRKVVSKEVDKAVDARSDSGIDSLSVFVPDSASVPFFDSSPSSSPVSSNRGSDSGIVSINSHQNLLLILQEKEKEQEQQQEQQPSSPGAVIVLSRSTRRNSPLPPPKKSFSFPSLSNGNAKRELFSKAVQTVEEEKHELSRASSDITSRQSSRKPSVAETSPRRKRSRSFSSSHAPQEDRWQSVADGKWSPVNDAQQKPLQELKGSVRAKSIPTDVLVPDQNAFLADGETSSVRKRSRSDPSPYASRGSNPGLPERNSGLSLLLSGRSGGESGDTTRSNLSISSLAFTPSPSPPPSPSSSPSELSPETAAETPLNSPQKKPQNQTSFGPTLFNTNSPDKGQSAGTTAQDSTAGTLEK